MVETDPYWNFVGRLLVDGGNKYCTATLIKPDRALTAKHCVRSGKLTVQFGRLNINEHVETIEVVGKSTKDVAVDGLAVVKLARPVTGVTPVRLVNADEGRLWTTGSRPRNYGWGGLGSSTSSAELRFSTLKVLDTTVSFSLYHGMLKAGEIGEGHPKDGDSGGPLLAFDSNVKAVVIGVLSSSIPTGAHYFMKTGANHDWIDNQ